ncbi:hypothetical protein D3C85_1378900 [compost metagenome]
MTGGSLSCTDDGRDRHHFVPFHAFVGGGHTCDCRLQDQRSLVFAHLSGIRNDHVILRQCLLGAFSGVGLQFLQCFQVHTLSRLGRRIQFQSLEYHRGIIRRLESWRHPTQYLHATWRGGFLQTVITL